MIKAIFLDIDGTMVSFETHIMPDNTRAALCAARRRGVKVFVATGRHSSDINNLGDMEFDGYVTLNGAYCKVGEEVVFKRSIPREDVEAFVHYGEQVRSSPVPCFFVEADRVVANMDDEEIRQMSELVKFVPRPIVPQRQLINNEIFQLTAFFPLSEEASIMKHLPGCCSTRWYPTFADIIARGVDKSVGLAKIGEYFGISASGMMSFGDGGNDVSMLSYAGTGVAMGNADDEVKCAADYITTSVDEDGIGYALRHFGVI